MKHLDKLHERFIAQHPEFVAQRKSDRVMSLSQIVSLITVALFIGSAGTFVVTMSMAAERNKAALTQAVSQSRANGEMLGEIQRWAENKDRTDRLQTIVLCSLIKGDMSTVCGELKTP